MVLATHIAIYECAAFIRAFEAEIGRAADAGAAPGLVHLCLGAEILEAAIAACLTGPRDMMTGSHRSHGLALARGADPVAVAAEILGRDGGLSGGLGGTQHLLAPEVGFLTSNGIVGGQVPLAAGAALSAKTQGTGGIAVAFFGDGAANQGAVLESMNLAQALGLPMLFVLENNGLGQSTAAHYAAGGANLSARARGFGLAVEAIDGGDLAAAQKSAARLADYVRSASAPALLEATVPRLGGHYHGEAEAYHTARPGLADPLSRARAFLVAKGMTEDMLAGIDAKAAARAESAVRQALAMPDGSDRLLDRWATALGGGA